MGLNKHNPYRLYFRQKLEIYNPHRYGTRFKSGVDLNNKRLGVGVLNGFIGGSSNMNRSNVQNINNYFLCKVGRVSAMAFKWLLQACTTGKSGQVLQEKKGPFQHNVTYYNNQKDGYR